MIAAVRIREYGESGWYQRDRARFRRIGTDRVYLAMPRRDIPYGAWSFRILKLWGFWVPRRRVPAR